MPRSIHEAARDTGRAIAKSGKVASLDGYAKKVEMLFAHLKRILKADRRCHVCADQPVRAQFLLAATAQNLRKLAC